MKEQNTCVHSTTQNMDYIAKFDLLASLTELNTVKKNMWITKEP